MPKPAAVTAANAATTKRKARLIIVVLPDFGAF
jgi:hypothetical protein